MQLLQVRHCRQLLQVRILERCFQQVDGDELSLIIKCNLTAPLLNLIEQRC